MSSKPRSGSTPRTQQRSSMRLLITGGSGVLGCALWPLAQDAGHDLVMPGHDELDLFDAAAVGNAARDVDGVLHLATRIRSLDQISDPDAWRENDRLRADASRILVDAAIAAGAGIYVQPTVTFVYPPHSRVDEDTPVREVLPILRSALVATEIAVALVLLTAAGAESVTCTAMAYSVTSVTAGRAAACGMTCCNPNAYAWQYR